MKLEILPQKTRAVTPPRDEIWDLLKALEIHENDIIFVTSKIVAIHQGRAHKIGEVKKSDLVHAEAEQVLGGEDSEFPLTIKNGAILPAAGIDESNSNEFFVLHPDRPHDFAREVWDFLRREKNVKDLGVVITDSCCTPLRLGTIGISIGFFGFDPLRNYVGEKDIFGRELHHSRVNLIDSLSAAVVAAMGEGAEQTPLAILRGAEVEFSGEKFDISIDPAEDLFKPLFHDSRK